MVDARLLELIEAEAWADIFRAAPAALAEEHGVAVLDLGAEAVGEPRYMIPVAPQCRPAELTGWLRGRGFEAGYAWMKFERGPEPAPAVETALEVRPAGPDDA